MRSEDMIVHQDKTRFSTKEIGFLRNLGSVIPKSSLVIPK